MVWIAPWSSENIKRVKNWKRALALFQRLDTKLDDNILSIVDLNFKKNLFFRTKLTILLFLFIIIIIMRKKFSRGLDFFNFHFHTPISSSSQRYVEKKSLEKMKKFPRNKKCSIITS